MPRRFDSKIREAKIDFNLSEHEKMLQSLAREFAVNEVQPQAAEIERIPMERLYCDAKMTEIYASVYEVHRSIIANHLLQR